MNELSPDKLRNEFDARSISIKAIKLTSQRNEIIGQERAMRALKFGLNIKELGFNVYVAGVPGSGRKTAVKSFLEEMAKNKATPSDWCYVNNFDNPFSPKAMRLTAGWGKEFRKDMKSFIDEVQKVLPKTFESEAYGIMRDIAVKAVEEKRQKLLAELNEKAQEKGFALRNTLTGVVTAPIIEGRPLSDEEFLALAPQAREHIEEKREELNSQLRTTIRQLRGLEKEVGERMRELDQEVTAYAIGDLVVAIVEKYKEFPNVKTYLEEVRNDIIENVSLFIGEPATPRTPAPAPWAKELSFRKYEVNVIVDNSALKGAPVIMELKPTHRNLFGMIEKEAQFGALTTDFTLIREGSLHRANGGYLVLPAEDLLANPVSFDSLKKALMNEVVAIEEPADISGFMTTKGLKPEPLPLNIKVVLIGSPDIHQELFLSDMEFKELFKVKAEFDTTMEVTDENLKRYAASIRAVCQKEGLRYPDASGLVEIFRYSSKLAEDQRKISARFSEIADIVREANFYALQEDSVYVAARHVGKAIDEKIYRSSLIQEKVREMIERNILLIDTGGDAVGQVNGLSVLSVGDFAFGAPSRVTASIAIGREGIIDIEREAKLGGPIHTKGVMILSGYLAGKYARNKPLSLSARIVFEQSYGMVEGDSASSTELYAILSALSEVPIKQSFAVTGSVNQKGEVQAIGGVNEKIEGYFEVCKTRELDGKQGVLIPESNVQNLMLKEDVIEAVRQGKFHIYPVKTIDQGIEILTGVKSGTRREDGTFEEGTVNYRVDKQLRVMAAKLKEFPEVVAGQRKEERIGEEEE